MVREALGSGATVLAFGGARRQMLPGPVGDLEAARLASGAANVVAYIENPAAHGGGTDSYTWAEVVSPDARIAAAELRTGEGVRATAAIAAETTRRAGRSLARRMDPGQLFGPGHRRHRRPGDRQRTAGMSGGAVRHAAGTSKINAIRQIYLGLVVLPAHDPGAAGRLAAAEQTTPAQGRRVDATGRTAPVLFLATQR